ncbi:MAG: DNA-binding transcriptional activator [Tannerella sp.]|nr:DNA-binding transcriptional activator [Tannerella sp.]
MLRFSLVLIYICISVTCRSEGLLIKGNDYLIEDRSTYCVFNNVKPVFDNRLKIDFEIAPIGNIGYVMRIMNEETNSTYNLLYDGNGESLVFTLNHEGKNILIEAPVKQMLISESHWLQLCLDFDLINDSVVLYINDERFTAKGLDLEEQWSPVIHFGKSEHVIDILTYGLRNLKVNDENRKNFFFPLNESDGEDVHDCNKKITGHVDNPVWLINSAYYWAFGPSFSSGKTAGSNFNPDTEDVYYFNEDSIIIYNIGTKETLSRRYANKCPMQMFLGTNFLDRENNRIYVYEVSVESAGSTTISYLDLNTYQWTALSTDVLPIQLHHHSNHFDQESRSYFIFGGFGNGLYSDKLYVYKLDLNKWDTLELRGDRITPRYFSSMGCSSSGKTLYLFGGMGNESGYQSVGRIYYYDLYSVDLDSGVVRKMWEIPWEKENMVPVRNMVLADDSTFYALCYPEHFSHSLLKLYRFSIDDGSFLMLGDSMPIVSEKITTHANLYFDQHSNELYSIVQEFENDDIASGMKLYSLLCPPATQNDLLYYKSGKGPVKYIIVCLLIILLLVAAFLIVRSIRRKKSRVDMPDVINDDSEISVIKVSDSQSDISVPNSIYLFGELSVFDRKNRNITYMLSAKLRQAFLLILLNSNQKNGITSRDLSEQLWPDKLEDKVKNSRGVTLNNLRKILSELEGLSLVYDKGRYRILKEDTCYCDYMRCLDIINKKNADDDLSEFVNIVSRGKFLKSLDDEFFDSFKASVEKELEPFLLLEADNSYKSEKYQISVLLSESILNIDPANEHALYFIINSLVKLNRKDEAKRKYLLFITEYKQLTGNAYGKKMAELIS